MGYINLHTHTEYSNLRIKDSTNKIQDVILYVANTLQQKGLAFCDHEYVGAHTKVLTTVEKLKKQNKIPQDFKPLLGNEIYLVDKEQLHENLANKLPVRFYHFILIAKDEIGHRQLQELSSRAWGNSFSYRGMDRVPTYYTDLEEIVDSNPGHLIASTACLGGFLGNKVLEGNYDSALGFIEWCQDVFGEDNFYLEMQPHRKEYDENGVEVITEQEVVNRWIFEQGLPAVITTDAHYLRKQDKKIHRAYLKSDEDDETYASGGRETDAFYSTTYFMSKEEMKQYLDYLPQDYIENCFANSVKVWETCEEYSLQQHVTIPQIPLPNNWNYNTKVLNYVRQGNYKNIRAMLDSSNEYDNYLMKLAFDGLNERVPINEWDATLQRLDLEMFELIGISKAKDAVVSSYFINTHKMLDIFWNEAECMVGTSRGSAAGWILNFLLQICHQNPLKQPMDMPHWRFISAERPDYPKMLG